MKTLIVLSALTTGLLFMAAASQDSAPKRIGEAYPLSTCPVSGRPLGDKPVVVVLSETPRSSDKGREVRFCCNGCRATFEKDLNTNLPELDDKIIKAQMAHYPAGNCIVMDDEKMTDPRGDDAMREKNVVIGNRLYRFCCKACIRKFKKNQKKYDEILDAMVIKEQAPTYPLEVCVISGRSYGPRPNQIVVANQLVRTCCGGCSQRVLKDPAKYLTMVNKASARK